MDANPRAATDAEIAMAREYLSREERPTRNSWTDEFVSGILARIAAAEEENADLRAKLPQATQSDRELAGEIINLGIALMPPTSMTTKECADHGEQWIAAHRESHVAPIRERLDQAVGLLYELRTWIMNWDCGFKDDPSGEWDEFEDGLNAFLATIEPTAEAKNAH